MLRKGYIHLFTAGNGGNEQVHFIPVCPRQDRHLIGNSKLVEKIVELEKPK